MLGSLYTIWDLSWKGRNGTHLIDKKEESSKNILLFFMISKFVSLFFLSISLEYVSSTSYHSINLFKSLFENISWTSLFNSRVRAGLIGNEIFIRRVISFNSSVNYKENVEMNECYMNKINLNNIFDIIPNELVEHIFFSPFRRDFYVRRTCKKSRPPHNFPRILKIKGYKLLYE